MRKRFWIVGVAIAVMAIVVVARQQHYAREKYEAARTKDCVALSVSPEEKHACYKEAQGRKEYVPWGYVLLTWPDGIVAWALLATLGGILWQAKATADTANAALGQIKIQEAGMGQWVDVEPLGCYIQAPPAGVRDMPFTINLRFEAVNNTDYPLDIQKIVTKIGMMPGECEVFTVETNVTSAPQEGSRSKRYAFYIPTQSITEEWFRGGTVITINGEITFRNCLGKAQTEYFGGLYRCGQINAGQEGMLKYMEALGIVPKRTSEKEYQP